MTTPYDYGLSPDKDATWSQTAGIPDGSWVVRDPQSGRLFFDPEPEDPATSLAPLPGFAPPPHAGPVTGGQTGAEPPATATHRVTPGPQDRHPYGFEAREYVTEISVPDFGDDGRQALYSPGLREPGPEPEAG
jgi:hypothetical protein